MGSAPGRLTTSLMVCRRRNLIKTPYRNLGLNALHTQKTNCTLTNAHACCTRKVWVSFYLVSRASRVNRSTESGSLRLSSLGVCHVNSSRESLCPSPTAVLGPSLIAPERDSHSPVGIVVVTPWTMDWVRFVPAEGTEEDAVADVGTEVMFAVGYAALASPGYPALAGPGYPALAGPGYTVLMGAGYPVVAGPG
jgi:hypothetical protein